VRTVTQAADAVTVLRGLHPRGVIPRGLGRAYGDAAQNSGGQTLDLTGLTRVGPVESDTGIVDIDAGTSLGAVVRATVPQGWFPPVVPGTRHVTLGGALAADVHGKNHHVEGTISRHVVSFDLLTADGVVRQVDPHHEADLFWATAGGMGLTGVILSVRMRMAPIETSRMLVETSRVPDLDTLLTAMGDDDHWRYSAAWIDCLARGRATGRAVLLRGDHARRDQLPPPQRADPLATTQRTLPAAPRWLPPGLLNRWTVAAFNEAYFRHAPRHHVGVSGFSPFFFPLDVLPQWNRIYGPGGFLQYQFVVPHGAEQTLRTVVEQVSTARTASFLAVLKRFGPQGRGPLSFPLAGWTLALDAPARTPGLSPLLRRLDQLIADAGGRIYLAKDSRLPPTLLPAMYPRLAEWQRTRRHIDPGGVFASDLSRRLRLDG
jgi:decaprenylphospho-beta-D-ribofuranose 2-oxidase